MKRSEAVETATSGVATIAAAVLGDADPERLVRRPSELPGWTVGHVLTHLARNAEGCAQMVAAADRGAVVDVYPGGVTQRVGDIEAGAGRPPEQLIDDLVRSSAQLAATMRACSPAAWHRHGRRWGTHPWPISDLPFLRCREVLLHASDLGVPSLASETWPWAYVEHELRRQLAAAALRLHAGCILDVRITDADWATIVMSPAPTAAPPVTVETTAREALAWLVGRRRAGSGWPALAPWTGAP